MSQLDDHIRAVLDRLRVTLSGQLEADLTASTSDIIRAVADEHRRALVEATERTAATTRQEGEQQLSAASQEFERERDELKQSAVAAQIGFERTLGEVRNELEAAVRNLHEGETSREALERRLEESRLDLEQRRQDLQQTRQELEQTRQEFERSRQDLEQSRQALEQNRQDLEQNRRELEQSQQDLEASRHGLEQSRRDFEQSQQDLQQTKQDLEQGQQGAEQRAKELQEAMDRLRLRLAQSIRLTSALRTLDEATSLGDVLDHLAQSACHETDRTAVFLVNGGKLRGWRVLGFDRSDAILGSDLEPAEAGVVGQAARLGTGQQHRNGDSSLLPGFAAAHGPRDAIALPVQVGGSVIAVLYADAARADRPDEPEWLDTIDAMAKHAGRVLEAMTVRQAAALWTPRSGTKRTTRETREKPSAGMG